jgi:cardiolipin synthase
MNAWRNACAGLVLGAGSACAGVAPVGPLPEVHLGEPSFYPTIMAHTDAPIVGGNRVELLFNGDQTFPAMLQAIRGAKTSISYAQYFFEGGAIAYELAEALAERCRAGVQVKILIDAYGGNRMPAEIPELLEESGCDFERFRRIKPTQIFTPWKLLRYNYRNHRRILVVDGRIGFTGGHGVSEAWTGDGRTPGHWRDTDARIEGPVVRELQAAFAESWRETTRQMLGGEAFFPTLEPLGEVHAQIVKSSPYRGSFEAYLLFLFSITTARESIHLTTPYFLPDERVREAMLSALKRGVRVVVLIPGESDHQVMYWASRRGFAELLRGGLEVHEYQPALMHAKTMVVDGLWATVGTTNLDNRSFALSEEINLTAYDAPTARSLVRAFEEDLAHSRRLTYDAWKSRPLREKLLELFTIPIKEQL